MNKLVKLFTIFISAIILTIASISSSFAKVEGEYIVLVNPDNILSDNCIKNMLKRYRVRILYE